MSVVADVVACRVGARRRLEAQYIGGPADGAESQLIDDLAAAASTSLDAMEVLLGLIQSHRLAQPGIRRLVVNEADVDDIEQAVLAVVALKVAQFRGDARFTTWLHQVASNEAKMFVRSKSRRPVETVVAAPERGYLARLSSIVGDRDVIERALDALPHHYRETLILRELEQLDYVEIAARLDLPVGTVRSRLHKARALMAREIGSLLDVP